MNFRDYYDDLIKRQDLEYSTRLKQTLKPYENSAFNFDYLPKHKNDNDMATQTKSSKINKDEDIYIKSMIAQGATELAQFNGHRIVKHPNDYVYNYSGTVLDLYSSYIAPMMSDGVITNYINDPSYNIVQYGNQYSVQYSELNVVKEIKKTKSFTVLIDLETKELLKGKEELESYGLLTPTDYHLNSNEEAIMNIQEIANHYAVQECKKAICDFNIEKHQTEFKKVYERELKTILTFKLNTNE